MSRPQPPADFAPPPFADPRRIGALVGLVGAVVFVFANAPDLTGTVATIARVVVILLVGAALVLLFGFSRWLGRFVVPAPAALVVYGACVVGELLLIRSGSVALDDSGHGGARPALIAAVVGLHFLPFAWAFRERMFYWLGSALMALGLAGLGAELAEIETTASVAAVLAGLVMAGLIVLYAAGLFAVPRRPVS
ncbi:hypothetical protein [Nocardioides sp. LHG3406-4]|uniref:hypothetical protein n=1 Tax=Nocardioides sp. LHG3406-4 TaxID=2804575 RepID=UPI003CE7C4B5